MQLYLKEITGKTYTFEVDVNQPPKALYQAVRNKYENFKNIKIIVLGKVLDENSNIPLRDYHLERLATIHLIRDIEG